MMYFSMARPPWLHTYNTRPRAVKGIFDFFQLPGLPQKVQAPINIFIPVKGIIFSLNNRLCQFRSNHVKKVIQTFSWGKSPGVQNLVLFQASQELIELQGSIHGVEFRKHILPLQSEKGHRVATD
jgi:hypothetical protein